MKIPVAAGARPGCPASQISPVSRTLDKKSDETADFIDSFKELSLESGLSKSTDSLTNSDPLDVFAPSSEDADESRYAESDSDSDSESSSSSDKESEDDNLVSKGPGREIKKTKENRLLSGPYPNDILNKDLYSGGHVFSLVSDSYYNWNYQAPPLNEPESVESCLNGFLDDLTADQKQILYKAIDLYTVEEMENFAKSELSSRSDEDSDYGTSSPNSSIHEPNSPLPEFESSYNPGINPPLGERSYPLFIMEPRSAPPRRNSTVRCPPQPALPESQPMTSGPRTIAPEPVVYETGMKQPATERIRTSLNYNHLGIEWIKILIDDEFIHQKDQNNETKLMAHLRKRNSPRYKEILHAMLERIRKEKFSELLQYKNHNEHSALSIAVNELKDEALIARYILEVLCELGHNAEEVDIEGNTWLHLLAKRGDEYVKVLAEFLNMETKEGFKFDVNKKNIYWDTPLHIAARNHSPSFSTLAMTKLLIKHHADISLKNQDGLTPVHLAVQHSCNSQLIKAILSSDYVDRAAVIADYAGDTALHYAAKRNDIPHRQQREVFVQLLSSQWQLKAKNNCHKVPHDYFDDQRRKMFQELFTKK